MINQNERRIKMYTQKMHERIQDALKKLEDEISEILEQDPDQEKYVDGWATFPVVYSLGAEPSDGDFGPPIFDPFIVHVQHEKSTFLDLPHDRYQINLKESVEDVINGFISGKNNKIVDEECITIVKSLRDAFLELAKMIDDRIA